MASRFLWAVLVLSCLNNLGSVTAKHAAYRSTSGRRPGAPDPGQAIIMLHNLSPPRQSTTLSPSVGFALMARSDTSYTTDTSDTSYGSDLWGHATTDTARRSLFSDEPYPSTSTSATLTITASSTGVPTDPAMVASVLSKALQCPVTPTPVTTSIVFNGNTTVFTSVGCTPTASPTSITQDIGTCHSSGYATYRPIGYPDVCCPDLWSLTFLASDVYCYTTGVLEMQKRLDMGIEMGMWIVERQVSTATAGVTVTVTPKVTSTSISITTLSGSVFTRAGTVVGEAESRSASAASMSSASAASASAAKNDGGGRTGVTNWQLKVMATVVAGVLLFQSS